MLRKVVSRGQTGADRAGLDFALEVGLEHGGYVPKGRRAEDGRIDEKYRLTEPALEGGSALTARCAGEAAKPCLHVHRTGHPDDGLDSVLESAAQRAGFLARHGIAVLKVAGSREGKEPGVYRFTRAVFREYWQTGAHEPAR